MQYMRPESLRVAIDDFANLPEQIGTPPGAIHQVRPVERADQDLRLGQAQLADDVVAHLRRGGGGVGMHGNAGKLVFQQPQAAVLGPEVVAPLADAVGLVDGDER